MWRKGLTILTVVLAMLITGSTLLAQQQVPRDRSGEQNDGYNESEYDDRGRNGNGNDDDRYESGYVRVDQYLDADIWVNRSDNEYFIGDNIKMHFRVNQDAYVAVVSIDSRGRVNLLYPSQPSDNPWRRGGVTYTLPGAEDNFDLVVDGPEGSETIQIIASRERFPIPDWYNGSGIYCNEGEDRDEFMDYLVSRYFDRYPDQRFAVDREVIWVNEWEQDYFRPVYYPTYPNWSVVGNMYFDYPWGSSIYIDGIYWGASPLYIPRVLVGWRTVTIYDRYGYGWEDYVHVSHYNTIVLNQTVIRPRAGFQSKYKDVRVVGYRDPVKAGYKNYNEVVAKHSRGGSSVTATPKNGVTRSKLSEPDGTNFAALPKKHLRGNGAVIKTDRGYESSAIGSSVERRKSERIASNSRFDGEKSRVDRGSYRSGNTGSSSDRGSYGTTSKRGSSGSSSGSGSTVDKSRNRNSAPSGSSDYYRKRSGSVDNRREGERKSRGEATRVERQRQNTRESGNRGSEQRSGGGRSSGEMRQRSSGSSSSSGGGRSGGEVRQRSSGSSSSSGGGRSGGGVMQRSSGSSSSGSSSGGSRSSAPRSSGGGSHGSGRGKR